MKETREVLDRVKLEIHPEMTVQSLPQTATETFTTPLRIVLRHARQSRKEEARGRAVRSVRPREVIHTRFRFVETRPEHIERVADPKLWAVSFRS